MPIRGEDGKVHKAGDLETAQAASSNAPASTSATPLTPGTSASASPVAPATATSSTPVPAPGEVTNQVSNAASTVADSTTSAAAPHTVSLETIPVELSESIGATRRTLQEYGLGNSTPSGWVQGALEWVHLTTGLPWWATIGATVIIVRMTLFPLMVRGISNNARLATIQPRLMANIATLKKAQKDGDTVKVQKLQMETRQLFMDNDCGPLRGLILPLVQMPLFVSFFFALRGMANAGLPDFATGGVAWFTNLSVPDPTYILPVISAAATLAVLQVGQCLQF